MLDFASKLIVKSFLDANSIPNGCYIVAAFIIYDYAVGMKMAEDMCIVGQWHGSLVGQHMSGVAVVVIFDREQEVPKNGD